MQKTKETKINHKKTHSITSTFDKKTHTQNTLFKNHFKNKTSPTIIIQKNEKDSHQMQKTLKTNKNHKKTTRITSTFDKKKHAQNPFQKSL